MKVYYNEWDAKAAAWLRELIRQGLLPDGDVDERSILDVDPGDLWGYDQWHFFCGIAGWPYALQLAGLEDLKGVMTGSPPCQPFSVAGQRKGNSDERHLAPKFAELVRAVRPRVLFGEQVASSAVFGKAAGSARNRAGKEPEWAWIDDLQDRLEAARYAVGTSDIPAAGVGAPHIRQRTFFCAFDLERVDDSIKPGLERHAGDVDRIGEPGRIETEQAGSAAQASGPGGVADTGVSAGREVAGSASRNENPDGSEGWKRGQSNIDNRYPSYGEDGGVADATGERSFSGTYAGVHRREEGAGSRYVEPQRSSASDGSNATNGFWGDADWLFCRDGKWRPVKSSVQRVAPRVPGSVVQCSSFVSASYPLAKEQGRRVMRLKGYGNAIVPQAAAVFIKSAVEAVWWIK